MVANLEGRLDFTFDLESLLKDAGLVAASAAATVGGTAKVINVGTAVMRSTLVIDVTDIEIASNNELYTVVVQGCAASDFSSGVQNLAALDFGATEVRPGGAADSVTGRFHLPFTNLQDGTIYPYIRVYTVVAGTIATGINYTAFMAKNG
ncbi:MAG: hypothetical protein HXY25_06965 [Alphaproteobacteria bacterium]|nr:hypothetical protein [Alphaproteobacteria bacterium]